MNYSIIQCVNGSFSIPVETSDLNNAKVNFHGICRSLWNEKTVITAKVMIVDEQLNCVEKYMEFIHHEEETQTNDSLEGGESHDTEAA